jgi:hypothetical protein
MNTKSIKIPKNINLKDIRDINKKYGEEGRISSRKFLSPMDVVPVLESQGRKGSKKKKRRGQDKKRSSKGM